MEGRRVCSILTIVLSEPTSQKALSSRWGATKHHKNQISIKPGKFPFIQNLQGDHKTIFVVENLNNIRSYGRTNMREPCSTLRLFETSRNTFHSVSYWSVQIHATGKQLTAHEREGAYTSSDKQLGRGTSTRTLDNNRLNCRIQPLHVGIQPPTHFSTVVFRNKT